jgi:tRNA pseudouridine55 synthase
VPASGGAGQTGLLLIDKPSGITSHDAIDLVRRALRTRKVGHAGTLDPLATGLLLVGVGRATRLLRFLADLVKEYEGTGHLGVRTTTLDAGGEVVERSPVGVSEADLRAVLAEFVGELQQVPPAYSAIKVKGERLYRAARRGEAVVVPPRTVRVFAFELMRFDPPRFDARVRCSSGTYVRSLVSDVGERLGCGAHLAALRRTAIGPFLVTSARAPDDPGRPLAVERAVEHLPAVRLDAEEALAARRGRVLGPAGIPGHYRLIDPEGRLIGVSHDHGARAVPDVVLPPG